MKIGIDGNSLTRNYEHGTKRYTWELIKHLAKINKKDQFVIFAAKKVKIPKQKNFKLVMFPRFPILKRQLFLPLMVMREKIDVFHNIDPYGPLFLKGPKIVTTVHDLDLSAVYAAHKSLRHLSNRLYSEISRYFVFKKTSMFVCDTKTTYGNLKKYIGLARAKRNCKIVSLGVPEVFKIHQVKMDKLKYFLCMADFSPRKNADSVFKAYSILPKQIKNQYKLYIIVSTKEESINIRRKVETFGIAKDIKFFTTITDKEVSQLYSMASAFIYPSLYEGFGLPILEAMSTGCPVITSNFGAMKETAGGAALLVNPKNANDIKEKLVKVIENKHLMVSIIKNGRTHAKNFNWINTAKNTLKIYKEAMKF